MKGMQQQHVEYLRDLLGRRSKRLSAKRDTKSQQEGALCAEIGKLYFGLKPEQLEKPAKEKPAKKPAEDRSHRLAPAPAKPTAKKAAPAKPAPAAAVKPGPVKPSPKITIPDTPAPAPVRRINDKAVH